MSPSRLLIRPFIVAGLAISLLGLAGCSASSDPPGGRGAGGPQGRLCRRPAERGAAADRARRAHGRVRDLGSAAAGQRPDPRAAISPKARYVRQGQPLYQIDPSLYQAAVNQAAANVASARATAEAAAGPGRPLPAAGRDARRSPSRIIPTPRRRPAQAARRRRPDQRGAARRRGSTCATPRIPAPISGRIGRSLFDRRRAGHRQPGRSAGGDPAARPDLCRHPAIERRPARAAARRWPRGGVDAGQHAGAAQARGRQRLRLHRHGPVLRDDGRREHRHGDAARPLPQSAGRCCCPACSSRRVFTQAVDTNAFLVPQAGAPARHRRRGLRVASSAPATRPSGARSSRPHLSAPTGS